MTRARVRLGAASVGLFVILVELGFALYNVAWIHGWMHPPGMGTVVGPLTPSFYRPVMLLGVAAVIGAVALYRATRDGAEWSWHASTLAPVAIFLVIYGPPVSHADLERVMFLQNAALPWTSPLIWKMSTFAVTLQIALYVAAAAFIIAAALAALRGSRWRTLR